jgi:hypothetical protein
MQRIRFASSSGIDRRRLVGERSASSSTWRSIGDHTAADRTSDFLTPQPFAVGGIPPPASLCASVKSDCVINLPGILNQPLTITPAPFMQLNERAHAHG